MREKGRKRWEREGRSEAERVRGKGRGGVRWREWEREGVRWRESERGSERREREGETTVNKPFTWQY